MQKRVFFKEIQKQLAKVSGGLFDFPEEPEELPPACLSLGSLIKTMRLTRGWTQEELAKLLEIPRQHLQKWEYNSVKPSQKHLRELLLILNYKGVEEIIRDFYV